MRKHQNGISGLTIDDFNLVSASRMSFEGDTISHLQKDDIVLVFRKNEATTKARIYQLTPTSPINKNTSNELAEAIKNLFSPANQ